MGDFISVICIECGCGRRSWLRTTEVGFLPLKELSRRLRCRQCGSSSVSVGMSDRIALPLSPRLEIAFSVDLWDSEGSRIEEVVAQVSSLAVGQAAFDAAVNVWPGRNLTYRQASRVIRKTGNFL